MSHTPEYEKLLAELKAGELPTLVRKILIALLQTPQGLTRKELIRTVFCEEPSNNLSNDTRDRKIRKAIEYLRNLGFPIVSTSGKAGYTLDTDPENIEDMIHEWESRIIHFEHRVNVIRHYRDVFLKIFHHK